MWIALAARFAGSRSARGKVTTIVPALVWPQRNGYRVSESENVVGRAAAAVGFTKIEAVPFSSKTAGGPIGCGVAATAVPAAARNVAAAKTAPRMPPG